MIQQHEVYRKPLSVAARREVWRQLTEAWKRSGQTQRGFCASQGLKLNDLKRWLYRLKRQAGASLPPTHSASVTHAGKDAAFVPLEVCDSTPSAQPSDTQASGMHIEHRSGFRIFCTPHTPHDALRGVLETLQTLPESC